MLVLSRKVNEEIVIGENIRIKLVAVHGSKVRIGIEAPNNVSIRRSEIPSREVEFAVTPPCSCDDFRPTEMAVVG